ncbi:MAG: ATP-binding protein [Armatimonadota bacterium]
MTTVQNHIDFLTGGGEMGELIRAVDWSHTAIGPMGGWSPALRMVLKLMLANRFPMILWWGPQFVQFYNDPYRPIPGNKHPRSMGQPASACWAEIWHVIGPLIETPFRGGPATWDDDIFLEINRHGFVEECHFTIAYSPVPDDTAPGGIGGVLATVHEITGKVVGDRRVLVLRDLGARSAEAGTAEEACAIAAETLALHPRDIPFALLYVIDPDRRQARLAGTAGVGADEGAAPPVLSLEDEDTLWPLTEGMRSETMQTVTDLGARLNGMVPPGPWTEPPHTAVVVPIRSNKAHHLAGFLVAGISPRLWLDDPHRDFLNLVSTQIATAIANAREYEEEKKRAEALAEIDRAKTAFFSNVSHEFRTPLTLMLGPIEELLSRSDADLSPAAKGQLESAHRNSLRLLRLVNTLLDFSRIEAGRMQAVFEPTDLAAFTAELASVFRAATERAGLQLTVECSALDEPVYVDRDMWEKIVLNLISNAFKFTFEGEIAVTLHAADGMAELRVRDTGVGIPAEALPRLFERFHRVPNMRSRTHEGSGIGLALVLELAKLHGGSVRAESQLGEGSTFVVSIPRGKAHLPAEQIGRVRTLASTAVGAEPFVEEALRWLPENITEEMALVPRQDLLPVPCPAVEGEAGRPRLLIADDNADMRQYLARLLAERYIVQAVSDGQAALAAARACRPDLILSDVMMPQLDGLGLVRELRADPDLRTVPIILLSARAGDEARVEGLQHGADDYLIKPFSTRELLARISAHLDMASLRKENEEALRESEMRYRQVVENTTAIILRVDPHGIINFANQRAFEFFGYSAEELIGRHVVGTIVPPQETAGRDLTVMVDQIAEDPDRFHENANENMRKNGERVWMEWTNSGIYDASGNLKECLSVGIDATEQKKAEEALRESEQKFRLLADMTQTAIAIVQDGVIHYANPFLLQRGGYRQEELLGQSFLRVVQPEYHAMLVEHYQRRRRGEAVPGRYEIEGGRRDGGHAGWYDLHATDIEFQGRPAILVTGYDITERKQMEQSLLEADRAKDEFLAVLSHELQTPLTSMLGWSAEALRVGTPEMMALAMPIVHRNALRQKRLIADLLDFSRLLHHKMSLMPVLLDLGEQATAAVEQVRQLATQQQLSLAYAPSSVPLPVHADPARLQQCIGNLLSNSLKFTPAGGSVIVRCRRDGDRAVLVVEDTGRGIPPEALSTVFQVFRQVDRDERAGGLGVGLAVTRGIIELHGGAIRAESEGEGRGSTFTITLPLAPGDAGEGRA